MHHSSYLQVGSLHVPLINGFLNKVGGGGVTEEQEIEFDW